jgi:transposase/transcriptional regulator with XRE-family HTH domain
MFAVESYAAVRRFVFVEGHSRREAARVFGLNRETVAKMCRFSLPPGYTRKEPAAKPKLGPLLPVIDAILEADQTAPVKQRHTAKRIFERLRDEHGFAGGYTVVKDHVRLCRARGRETFVPLAHPPGHAQVDFGEAIGVIGGVRQKIHFLCMDLPQSDACFLKAYPRETTEAFLDGHVSAFAFFDGVPLSILYDNTTIAVASGTPQVLLAHHLKQLKLPTVLREYDKVARECARDGTDHPRYLLRLIELELRAPIGALFISSGLHQQWPAFTPPRWPGIRPALTAADLTQVQLAAALGISQPQLAFYELGKRRVPVSMLPGLAKVLGISIEALIADDGSASVTATVPRRTRHGPVSKLEQQLDAIAKLPKARQKFVSEMLDNVLGPNMGAGTQGQEAATA